MYSIWAAATRGTRVFAFEPESQNYALLNKNIYFNQLVADVTAAQIEYMPTFAPTSSSTSPGSNEAIHDMVSGSLECSDSTL